MRLVTILGYLNVCIFIIVLSLGYIKTHRQKFNFTVPHMDILHKYLGGTILIIGAFHSYLATGFKYFHPGMFIYLVFLLNIVFIKLFKITKKKIFFTLHTKIPYLLILMVLGHILDNRAII